MAPQLAQRVRNITSPILNKNENLKNPHNLPIISPESNPEFM
jgi:hypothetical protein